MMTNHARLGPSNPRWVHCPGSVREESVYPDVSSEAAIDGTRSHALLDFSLEDKVFPSTFVGRTFGSKHGDCVIDEKRAKRVMCAYSYVLARIAELERLYTGHKVKVESESKSNPGTFFGRDDWWGTCDITLSIITPEDHVVYIEVIDYKDGLSLVEVKDNTQLLSYLGGKLGGRTVFVKDCQLKMTIIQPRTLPIIRSHSIPPYELTSELEKLNRAAKKTDKPKAPLIPDKKDGKGYCKWCKHKPNCEALKKLRTKAVFHFATLIDDLQAMSVASENFDKISSQELGNFLRLEAPALSAFGDIKKEVEKRLSNDEIIPGYEMLPGRSNKKWNIPDDELMTVLLNFGMDPGDILPGKLISPAQTIKHEKLTEEQKDFLERKYIEKVKGGLKLKEVKFDVSSFKDVI